MKTFKRILATLLVTGMLSGCLVGLTGCGESDLDRKVRESEEAMKRSGNALRDAQNDYNDLQNRLNDIQRQQDALGY